MSCSMLNFSIHELRAKLENIKDDDKYVLFHKNFINAISIDKNVISYFWNFIKTITDEDDKQLFSSCFKYNDDYIIAYIDKNDDFGQYMNRPIF